MTLHCQDKKDIKITVIKSYKKFGKTIYIEGGEKQAIYVAPPLKAECYTQSFQNLNEFIDYIETCQKDNYHSYSFTYGITDYDKFTLASKVNQNLEEREVARVSENYHFKGKGILFLDVDKTDATPEELYNRLLIALPELKNVQIAWRPSSSSFIYNNDTGEYLHKNYGHRFYAVVDDMTKVQKFAKNLITRLSANQNNMIATSSPLGKQSMKCIFDDMAAPERMDLISNPTLHKPLTKIYQPTIYFGKDSTINSYVIRNSVITQAILKQVKQVVIQKPKNKYTVAQLRKKYGRDNYEKLNKNILPEKHELYLQNGKTILAEDWHNHIGLRLSDPIEPTYLKDTRIALINDNGTIYSHAHGGILYQCPQKIVSNRLFSKAEAFCKDKAYQYDTNLKNSCQDLKQIFDELDTESLIIAPAGIGKTKAMIEYIAEHPNLKIGIAVQNDKMAQQIAEDLKKIGITDYIVYKGLEKSCIKYTPEETSSMIELLNKLQIHHNSFSSNICAKGRKGVEEYCEYYEHCPYQSQKRLSMKKSIVIFSQQLLYIDSVLTNTIKPINFDVLFIDEDPLTSRAIAKTVKADNSELQIAFKCLKDKKPIENKDVLKKIVSKEKEALKQQYIFINDLIKPNVNIFETIKALKDFMNDYKVDKKLIKAIDTILDEDLKKYITNDLTTMEFINPIEIKINYAKMIILDATPFIPLYKKALPDIKVKTVNCLDGNTPINVFIKANNKTKNDVYSMTTLKKEETIDIIVKVAETAQREWKGNVGVITTLEVSKRLSAMGLNALHYGCRGLNSFADLDVLILAGRIMPPENYLRQLANYVFNLEIDKDDLKGLVRNIKMVQEQKISYFELKHPKLLEIANNFIEQTITQAKERMRTLRGKENRLCIFLGVPVIDGFIYDFVLTPEDFLTALFKKC